MIDRIITYHILSFNKSRSIRTFRSTHFCDTCQIRSIKNGGFRLRLCL